MTDPVLEELLAHEGLAADGLDDLVAWAKERAAQLAAQAAEDAELGPLLSGTVVEGERRPVSHSDATTEPRAVVDVGDELDVAAVVTEAVGGLLETDAPNAPVRTGQTQPNPTAGADADAVLDELSTPSGPDPVQASEDDEDIEELDDVELLDDDELEMIEDDEDEGPTEGSQAAPPPAPPAAEAPTYGPPDGSQAVPAWKAALYSAEMGDDKAAAERVKEESYVGPMPEDLPDPESEHRPAVASQRLVAEEDEISQHKIDLSDLDGDPESPPV